MCAWLYVGRTDIVLTFCQLGDPPENEYDKAFWGVMFGVQGLGPVRS